MKNKVNLFGICFDWRVLLGLVAIGVAIAVFAPELLSLNFLFLLAVLACPLSMLFMMNMMNKNGTSSVSSQRQLKRATVDAAFSSKEQLAHLREQLQLLQEQQDVIASQINVLERDELRSQSVSQRKSLSNLDVSDSDYNSY